MMPVFFLITGLKTSWDLESWVIVAIALLMVVVQLTGKHLGVWISSKLFNRNQTETTIIGWLLQTKGLIEIIFASILLDAGIITNQMFTVLLLMAVISTLLTVPMVTEKIKQLYKNI
jgi:Kef-type K+ transport system membrane component KefB